MLYKKTIKLIALLGIFIVSSTAFAHEEEQSGASNASPPAIGNFILPGSQQPAPLVSFGQNIIGKNQAQLFLTADDFVGVNKHFAEVIPGLLYGITDNFSVLLNVPVAVSFHEGNDSSSGIEDSLLQFEYAYYNKSTKNYVEQGTIVAGITFPTGSYTKDPSTGTGSPNFFLGTTFSRMYTDWFMFVSPGALLTTYHNGTKFGNQFLYQAGLGRNIATIDSKTSPWIFAWQVEIDGQYSQKDTVKGVTESSSGGNVVYVTPSLWISSKKLIFQIGVGFPVAQNLFGDQTRNSYLVLGNVVWTLN